MKAPTKQLTPEVRKKVAEAATGDDYIIVEGGLLQKTWLERNWEPESNIYQREKLTHKLAQVIEAMDRDNLGAMMRFNEALAANDTTALEALLAELMGWEG